MVYEKISEHYLKDKEAFRDYDKEDEIGQRVKRTYTEMHTNQTVEFVRGKHEKWLKFNHFQATVMEVGVNIFPDQIIPAQGPENATKIEKKTL